jgi:hypothetical protein
MHSHRQTLPSITVKILTARALNLYHTMFWNIKEDVCLTALHHTEKLATYGMSYLAFFTVRWMTASSHTAQCVSPLCERRKLKYKIQNKKLTNKSHTPKIHPSFITPGCTSHQFLRKPPFIGPHHVYSKNGDSIFLLNSVSIFFTICGQSTQQLTRHYTQIAVESINLN